jgi:hypothetical protein
MKNRLFLNAGRLARELADLPTLDRRALREKWRIIYGIEPPGGVRNNFLMHAIAHRMQEQASGGLEPATLRFLEKTSEDNTSRRQTVRITSMKPGTRILREWHGVTYEVIIQEDGVKCNGICYRSLSEVARAITGTRWSGPLFFGLKKKEAA